MLSSGGGYDYLYGQDGNDVMRGGSGSTYFGGDDFDGGNGIDTVTLHRKQCRRDGQPGDRHRVGRGTPRSTDIPSVENVDGSGGNDASLIGNGGANALDG